MALMTQEQNHLRPPWVPFWAGVRVDRMGGREGVPALDWGLGWCCHMHGHSWSHTDPTGQGLSLSLHGDKPEPEEGSPAQRRGFYFYLFLSEG